MKKTLLSLCVFSTSMVMATTTPEVLVVKLKAGTSLPKLATKTNVQNLFETTYVFRTKDPVALKKELEAKAQIEYIEKSYRSEKTKLPVPQNIPTTTYFGANDYFNDPKVNQIWSFNDANQYGVSVNAAYRVHAQSNTTTITVAVVDTGVDYNHEDLKDVMWTNTNEIPGNNIDDDKNGYVDDVFGINTLKRDSAGRATGNPMDTHSHGTHVAGTIGAKQNNKTGIAGIASNVKIMAIRTVPNNGDETDVDVAESFLYAAKNGARLINCSFGKSANEGGNLIPDTIRHIGEKYGTLVVAAAGNDSSDIDKRPTYPASHKNDNLLIIASTSSSGGLSYFSNYGKINVDIAAPGSNIFSTVPGNKYSSMSGTSMATPTTVGVLAEILSHHPELGAIELKKLVMDNVSKVSSFKGKMISEGRIDLLKTLDAVK